jgi:hypothetical protein
MRRKRVEDVYVERWKTQVAGPDGPAPGSRLRLRVQAPERAVYEVKVRRGEVASRVLAGQRWCIAGLLSLDGQCLLLEVDPASPRRMWLTIVAAEVYESAPRFVEGMCVKGATIGQLGDYVDGQGQLEVTMREPLALVGAGKTGRSTTARHVTVAALRPGTRQLMLVDPEGTSPKALRLAARVALVGPDAAQQAGAVLEALVRGRAAFAKRRGLDVLPATPAQTGWVLLADDFQRVAGDPTWAWSLQRCSSLGMWPVAVNRSMSDVSWGGRSVSALFSGQVQLFASLETTRELMPNLLNDPADMLVDRGGRVRRPGVVIDVGPWSRGIPAWCRWLPADEQLDTEPPLRLDDALAQCALPALPAFDFASLTALLGDPVGERWEIGPEGTHTVPADRLAKRRRGEVGQAVADARHTFARLPVDRLVHEGYLKRLEPGVWGLSDDGPRAGASVGHAVVELRHAFARRMLGPLVEAGYLRRLEPDVWALPDDGPQAAAPAAGDGVG